MLTPTLSTRQATAINDLRKRAAFEALAALVERIVRPPADVVVPIRGAKSARRK
jgi:hypothetical protein